MMKKPELLAPAGNLEKMKMALLYGADAVYLGGKLYGLRALGGNFTQEELREAGATYTRLWGWSIAGGKEVPEINGLEPVRLDWSLVGGEDGKCYNEEVIKNAVEPLLYGAGKSTHQGEIGERLRNIPVVVVSCNQFTSNFGDKNVITFEDEYENVYVWFTTTRSLEAGTHWILTGTVKAHNVYKGTAQTTLTRCSLVKND